MDEIDNGFTSVAVLRHESITPEQLYSVACHAETMAIDAPKYDWQAILKILCNTVFRRNSTGQREWRWYCTEAVRGQYMQVSESLDVWGKALPTPLTTEKRVIAGELRVIAELGTDSFKTHCDQKLMEDALQLA